MDIYCETGHEILSSKLLFETHNLNIVALDHHRSALALDSGPIHQHSPFSMTGDGAKQDM